MKIKEERNKQKKNFFEKQERASCFKIDWMRMIRRSSSSKKRWVFQTINDVKNDSIVQVDVIKCWRNFSWISQDSDNVINWWFLFLEREWRLSMLLIQEMRRCSSSRVLPWVHHLSMFSELFVRVRDFLNNCWLHIEITRRKNFLNFWDFLAWDIEKCWSNREFFKWWVFRIFREKL